MAELNFNSVGRHLFLRVYTSIPLCDIPSKINCTAKADRSTPKIRSTTCMPVTPSKRCILLARRNMTNVSKRTKISEDKTTAWRTSWPSVFTIRKIAAPIAPGPAINGVAIGKTEMSRFPIASCCSSSVVDVPPEERAKTISIPIKRRRMPPAVLSAGIEMPSIESMVSPIIAKEIKIHEAIIEPRIAMRRRYFEFSPPVKAANTAAASSGAIVAKKVARAAVAVSNTRLGSIRVTRLLLIRPRGLRVK